MADEKTVSKHTHRLSKDKFLDALKRRGWTLNETLRTWLVPTGRTIHQQDVDWQESVLEAIECECPHDKENA